MSSIPWKDLQHLPGKEQHALQNQLLKEMVQKRLYPFSAHYRALFDREGIRPEDIRRVEDLANLPLTSKRDLLPTEEDPDRSRKLVLAPDKELIGRYWSLRDRLPLLWKALTKGKASVLEALRREYYPIFMTFTTGRSAQPVPFLYSRHDLDELGVSGQRLNAILGFHRDWRVLNLFPYAPHLAFWQVAMAGFAGGNMVLGTGGGKVAGTEGNLRGMQRLQPEA
ncbi:MAG TPA: hypothetical protein VKA04_11560, partial [Pseudodesulfovibrio sp.]|nr:hypothetical protein [Pseudodesulfovibrio sp.]